MTKRICSVLLVLVLSVLVLPFGRVYAADGDADCLKITVDTGGLFDISFNPGPLDGVAWTDSEDPNVIYIDKGKLNDVPEDDRGLIDLLLNIELPEVEGYRPGPLRETHPFSLVEPSGIKGWADYNNARADVFRDIYIEEFFEDSNEITLYVIWFKQLDTISLRIEAPVIGDELDRTVVKVDTSDEPHMIMFEEMLPYWCNWDEEDDLYGLPYYFSGTVEADGTYYADIPFFDGFGYYYDPAMSPEDVTVVYTGPDGKDRKAEIVFLYIFSDAESELDESSHICAAVKSVGPVPDTGDESGIFIWAAAAVLSALTLAGIIVCRKRIQ